MGWKIVQCCEPGKKHESSVCQDNCYKIDKDVCKVMVLCDGTSDAEFSDFGSKYIAEFSARYMKKYFDELYCGVFSKLCELLTNYHQEMLMYLSKRAEEAKGISIVVDRTISNQELRKFCSTVQVVAVKENKAIYFKVGNGSAVIVGSKDNEILSDSSTESPTKHVTLPNTLTVLGCSEFKSFELSSEYRAIVLMTDGVEFKKGLYYNHEVETGFSSLRTLIESGHFSDENLQSFILQLKDSPYNTARDDIGISVLYNPDRTDVKSIEMSDVHEMDSPKESTEMSTRNMEDFQQDTYEKIAPVLYEGVKKSTMGSAVSSSSKKCSESNRKKESQIGTIEESRKDEEDKTDFPKKEDKKKRIVKNGKRKKSNELKSRLLTSLLLSLIMGMFVGGYITKQAFSNKIEQLVTEIGELTELIESLELSINEIINLNPTKSYSKSDNVYPNSNHTYSEYENTYGWDLNNVGLSNQWVDTTVDDE